MHRILTLSFLATACYPLIHDGKLSPAFGRTWVGTATLSRPGLRPLTYPATIVVDVSGDTASISGLCPDGSGTVLGAPTVADGASGDSLRWSSSLSCRVMQPEVCSFLYLFMSGGMTLGADGKTLDATASGTVDSGCGDIRPSVPFTYEFHGG